MKARTAGEYDAAEAQAFELDARDPLGALRSRFTIPPGPDGADSIYLCGNSLGLQPLAAREAVARELAAWGERAVDAHFRGPQPWYSIDERHLESMAHLVGAGPDEVVLMNGLTVNLHLLLTSFYRPVGDRFRVLTEERAFPSDRYALQTHLRARGIDPAEAVVRIGPRPGEDLLREEDIEAALRDDGSTIALVFLGGIDYLTGQLLDLPRLAGAGLERGCAVGFDLAHAVGNVPLRLHEWDIDFAVWCMYKYVSGGPGAPGGAFVHRRHGMDAAVSRLAGWWGNDPRNRFRMEVEFVPRAGALGWQLSNPPVLAMAALGPALAVLEEAGIDRVREKSRRLTGYLEWLIDRIPGRPYEIVTPRDPERRGAQLSVRVSGNAGVRQRALGEAGVVCDFREPDILRLTPSPLYNSYHEVWRATEILADLAGTTT